MDPISAAIIAAATAGVTGGIQNVGKDAIVDAYKGLKNWIVKKVGRDAKVTTAIAEVEQAPDSKARQMVLAEEMEMAKMADESDLLTLANKLVGALKETDAGRQALQKFNIDASSANIGIIGDHARVEEIHLHEAPAVKIDPFTLSEWKRLQLGKKNRVEFEAFNPPGADEGHWVWEEGLLNLLKKHNIVEKKVGQLLAPLTWQVQSDPVIDVTLVNRSQAPSIVSQVGIELLSVGDIPRRGAYGLPMTFEIELSDTISIDMPETSKKMEEEFQRRCESQDLSAFEIEWNKMYLHTLEKPHYLGKEAPYRFRLVLSKYFDRLPILARLRLIARAGQELVQSPAFYVLKYLNIDLSSAHPGH